MVDPNAPIFGEGESLVSGLLKGKADPTLPEVQQQRKDMSQSFADAGKSFMDFFGNIGKFFSNKWMWIVVLLVLLIIVGKKVFG